MTMDERRAGGPMGGQAGGLAGDAPLNQPSTVGTPNAARGSQVTPPPLPTTPVPSGTGHTPSRPLPMGTLMTSQGAKGAESGRPGMGRGIRSMVAEQNAGRPAVVRPTQAMIAPGKGSPANEVFLTPRVIDQAAFDELAKTLREMVREAAKQNADLRASVAQADRLGRELRDGEQTQQENLTLAAEALRRIEAKSRHAEEILERASNTTAAENTFEVKAEELIAKRLGVLEAKVAELSAKSIAQAEAAERRIESAGQRVEIRIDELHRDAESSVGPALTRLTAVCERAEALIGNGETPVTGSLGDLVARGETLREGSVFATKQFDAVRQQADQARSILGESLNDMCAMIDRLTDRADELRRESERARSVAAEVHADVDAQSARIRRSAEEAVAAAKPSVDAISADLERALAHAKQIQGESVLAVRVADTAAAQLRDLIVKLEPWQRVIDAQSADERALPVPIRQIVETVRGEMRRDLGSIAASLRAAADRAQNLGEQMLESDAPQGTLVPVTRIGARQTAGQDLR